MGTTEAEETWDMFVSYSHDDHQFVKILVNDIKSRGGKVWFDKNISGGVLWREEIAEAISRCKNFLLVLSPTSVQSKYVVQELFLAEQQDKTIIPILLQPVKIPPKMEMALAGIHYLDFVEGHYEEHLKTLIEALNSGGVRISQVPVKIDPFSPEQKVINLLSGSMQEYQDYRRLMSKDKLALLKSMIEGLEFTPSRAEKVLILKSIIDTLFDIKPWLGFFGSEVDAWLKEIYEDPKQPIGFRLKAVYQLGAIENDDIYQKLLLEAFSSKHENKAFNLQSIANFIHGSETHRNYPLNIWFPLEMHLIKLRVRTFRQRILKIAFVAGIVCFLSTIVTSTFLFQQVWKPIEDEPVYYVVPIIVLSIASGAFMFVGGSLLDLVRVMLIGKNWLIRVLILVPLGSAFGYLGLLIMLQNPFGEIAGALLGFAIAFEPMRIQTTNKNLLYWIFASSTGVLSAILTYLVMNEKGVMTPMIIPSIFSVGILATFYVRYSYYLPIKYYQRIKRTDDN